MYQQYGKRWLDLIVAVVLLILLLPVFVVVAMLVRLKLGSPVIFRQQRPGLYGKPFIIFKFRTMLDARDAHGNLSSDAERLTPFGQFLRSLSLDELPELFNILKGEMSLIGPRPLLMEYLERYTPEQARRHDAKPGITGWAQVHGRNTISWEEKFAYDVWYVDHCSFWLDLEILCLSLWKVVQREGITQPGQATVQKFSGHRS